MFELLPNPNTCGILQFAGRLFEFQAGDVFLETVCIDIISIYFCYFALKFECCNYKNEKIGSFFLSDLGIKKNGIHQNNKKNVVGNA